MNKPKRNPLNKENFLQGMRQKWTAVLLTYSFIVMFIQIKYNIPPAPYMDFALTIGSLFILGGSVDSYLQISAARSITEKKIDKDTPNTPE